MINVVVEGDSDSAAARAIVRAAGHEVGKIYVTRGKDRLDRRIAKYNQAARHAPWVLFRDSDGECPVTLRGRLMDQITAPTDRLLLRIAHTMTEAWLLSDLDGFATYFGVSRGRIPQDAEALPHAKRELLNLCTKSRRRDIRLDMITADGQTGPLYVHRINDFASTTWNCNEAASRSPSLSRAIDRIREVQV